MIHINTLCYKNKAETEMKSTKNESKLPVEANRANKRGKKVIVCVECHENI